MVTGAAADAVLVQAVRHGDPDAFEHIYRRYAAVIRAVIASIDRDATRVDDGVQEVFLKALDRLDSLREADRLEPWLKAIARNVALDNVRVKPASDIDELAESAEAGAATPSDLAEVRELARLVRGALVELPPRDLEAVTLAGYMEATSAEIAESLGVTEGAAKVILHRARKRLRLALKLEMLVRRRTASCPEFRAQVDAGEVGAAALHLAKCETCLRAGSAELQLFGAATAPTGVSDGYCVIRQGGESRTVEVFGRLVIGRDLSDVPGHQQLVIDDEAVSRRHAELRVERTTGEAFLLDTSTNGTILDGARIERAVLVPVHAGDVARIGNVEIEFHVTSATVDPSGPQLTVRRQLTAPMLVAVGDVVGYTSIAETTDSAVLSDELDAVYSEFRALLRLYGGTLGNVVGDAFFAVWDIDGETEPGDRVLQFVDAAEIVVGPTRFNLGWGVSAGRVSTSVLAGLITTVVGDAVNVGFRLSGIAGRNGQPNVLLTREAVATCSAAVDLTEPFELAVKGRNEAVVCQARTR